MENTQKIAEIKYPYLPEGKNILYVGEDDKFMAEAKKISKNGCCKQPTGAVLIKDGKIIGRGSNAGKLVTECPRWGSPTGENYGPCKEICHQEGHAEVMAIKDAENNQADCEGANIYLYGHWWCCKDCWDAMIKEKIKNVYLLDKSWEVFNPAINMTMKNWGKPLNL
jgi:deoxycytidylate deaminase